jgi:hypothetical protein
MIRDAPAVFFRQRPTKGPFPAMKGAPLRRNNGKLGANWRMMPFYVV